MPCGGSRYPGRLTVVQPCGVAGVRRRGSGSGYVENWTAFVPGTGGDGGQPGPAVAVSTRAEDRARTLSLIDFLADYDARRNPPVYDISRYDQIGRAHV